MIQNSTRLPVTTYLGHTDRALSFIASDSIYFALGKYSPWDEKEDEKGYIPPAVDLEAEEVEELICMKRVRQKLMVVPDEAGEIEYDGGSWKVITNEEAIRLKSRWVYITMTMKYAEIDPTQYRQVALYNHVIPKEGITKELLLPEEIEDTGLLIALNNRGVITRQPDTRDIYSMIIEF